MTPQERSCLVFADRLRCFADLERLCVISRNIQANDASRDQVVARDPKYGTDERRTVLSQDSPGGLNIDKSGNERGYDSPKVKCFSCGSPGHIRRFCFVIRSRPTPSPKASKAITCLLYTSRCV